MDISCHAMIRSTGIEILQEEQSDSVYQSEGNR